MSLLINGMNVPRNKGLFYDLLLSLSFDGSGEIFFNGKSYPITEIPTPHGRLIDADAIMDLLEKSVPEKNRGHQFYVFRHMLRNAPTIIEEEE